MCDQVVQTLVQDHVAQVAQPLAPLVPACEDRTLKIPTLVPAVQTLVCDQVVLGAQTSVQVGPTLVQVVPAWVQVVHVVHSSVQVVQSMAHVVQADHSLARVALPSVHAVHS